MSRIPVPDSTLGILAGNHILVSRINLCFASICAIKLCLCYGSGLEIPTGLFRVYSVMYRCTCSMQFKLETRGIITFKSRYPVFSKITLFKLLKTYCSFVQIVAF